MNANATFLLVIHHLSFVNLDKRSRQKSKDLHRHLILRNLFIMLLIFMYFIIAKDLPFILLE